MPEYLWKLKNVQQKPNSRCGNTARLVCYTQDGEELGWCYIEGWLYGCALMGLSQLSGLGGVPLEAWDSFTQFLRNTKVTLGGETENSYYHNYTSKRYMFTTAHEGGGTFYQKLLKESKKQCEFENLTHSSSINNLYFLTLGN